MVTTLDVRRINMRLKCATSETTPWWTFSLLPFFFTVFKKNFRCHFKIYYPRNSGSEKLWSYFLGRIGTETFMWIVFLELFTISVNFLPFRIFPKTKKIFIESDSKMANFYSYENTSLSAYSTELGADSESMVAFKQMEILLRSNDMQVNDVSFFPLRMPFFGVNFLRWFYCVINFSNRKLGHKRELGKRSNLTPYAFIAS